MKQIMIFILSMTVSQFALSNELDQFIGFAQEQIRTHNAKIKEEKSKIRLSFQRMLETPVSGDEVTQVIIERNESKIEATAAQLQNYARTATFWDRLLFEVETNYDSIAGDSSLKTFLQKKLTDLAIADTEPKADYTNASFKLWKVFIQANRVLKHSCGDQQTTACLADFMKGYEESLPQNPSKQPAIEQKQAKR